MIQMNEITWKPECKLECTCSKVDWLPYACSNSLNWFGNEKLVRKLNKRRK